MQSRRMPEQHLETLLVYKEISIYAIIYSTAHELPLPAQYNTMVAYQTATAGLQLQLP